MLGFGPHRGARMTVEWTRDIAAVRAGPDAARLIREAVAAWIVVEARGSFWVFPKAEASYAAAFAENATAGDGEKAFWRLFAPAFAVRSEGEKPSLPPGSPPPAHLVLVGEDGRPAAVGIPRLDAAGPFATRPGTARPGAGSSGKRYLKALRRHPPYPADRDEAMLGTAPPGKSPPFDASIDAESPYFSRYALAPQACLPDEALAGAPASGEGDEGIRPVRYPSLEAEGSMGPGSRVAFLVDLPRAPTGETAGGALALGELLADWEELEIGVALGSSDVAFEGDGRGVVRVRRNADSVPARIFGTVAAGTAGPVSVGAAFFMGTRFCGSATRVFGALAAEPGKPEGGTGRATGMVRVEHGADRPDLTALVASSGDKAGACRWTVLAEPFDGLPPNLSGDADLGRSPAEEAAALAELLSGLPRGRHRAALEGFGSKLWDLAPAAFRDAYWAVWDRLRRPFSIQFVSDESDLPWELMRPYRERGEGGAPEVHPPLALRHPTARWIERYRGYLLPDLPAGRIVTIAPAYRGIASRLPRAQAEAAALEARFGAERVPGTAAAVAALLETKPAEPVALLHFAGHGGGKAAGASIELEDGDFLAAEAGRPEVALGAACRTLVFFNACGTGACGTVFGRVGGWADAFLGRKFGGFIAPLWAVDDEDAGAVAVELLEAVYERGAAVAEALRDVRARHGDESPTFFSYLYFGDVCARAPVV